MIESGKLVNKRFRLLEFSPSNCSINLLNYSSNLSKFNWLIIEIIKFVEEERVASSDCNAL